MLPTKSIIRAVVSFTVVFGLLSFPWSGWTEAYSRAFQRAGTAAFGTFGDNGIVRFQPAERVSRISDTEITTKLKGSRYLGVDEISPRLMGYLPTVELIALILASAVGWRRRLIAIFGGLLLIHVFLYARLWLLIRVYFSGENQWQQYYPGPTTLKALKLANEVINIAPTASFVVPVLIWIAVTFRYSDWERIMRREPADTASTTTESTPSE